MKNGRRAETERGMVLVAVLWVLVAMTLAASVFSLWVDGSRDRAGQLLTEAEAHREARSLQAAIIFTRLTGAGGPEGVPWPAGDAGSAGGQPVFGSLDDFLSGAPPRQAASTSAGFLRMDGAPMVKGRLRILVQDRAGLVGLLGPGGNRLFERFAAGGVPGLDAERLRDTLADYTDADHLRRINGAERLDYERRGRAAPLDGALRSPLQLRDLLFWDQVLEKRSDAWLLENLRADGGAFINANTAPRDALELVMPDADAVGAILAERRARPLRSVIAMGSGEEFPVGVLPGEGLRIWWWLDGGKVAHVDDVQFDILQVGRDAISWNWSTRVAISEELAERPVEQVDHPFFHTEDVADR